MLAQTVWLLGDHDHREFAAACDFLRGRFACQDGRRPADFLDRDRAIPAPQAIVIFAARPGRFAAADIEQLYRREPLARLMAVLGSYCEGEVRSGKPWPGVARYYWHQWPALAALFEGSQMPPRTASPADRAEQAVIAPIGHGRLLAICTARQTAYEALADACALAGFRSYWQLPHLHLQSRGVDLLLCDGDLETAAARSAEGVPLMAILDFPRMSDEQRALAAGYSAVIARPFELSCLFAVMQAALQATPSRMPSAR